MAFVAPTAGRAATRRASSRRNLAGVTDAGEVRQELARRRTEAAQAKEDRAAAAQEAADERELQDEHEDQDDEHESAGGRRRLDRMEPASSGAGLVLGVIVWAAVLNYMEGGVPQVKRLFAAKFLNRTGG